MKQHKNDAADAEAFCEAACWPGMRFVAAKSAGRRRTQYCSGHAARTSDGARGRGDDVGNADLEEVLPGCGFRPRNAEAGGVGYAGLAEESANAKDH